MLQRNRTSVIPWRIGIWAISIFCLWRIMTNLNHISRFTPNITDNDILSLQRQIIIDEMTGFEYNDTSLSLNSLTPATGGKPFLSVIVTSWRSGSTFFGEILNAMPANFYSYEPLLNYGVKLFRDGSPQSDICVQKIRQFLTCNFTNMDAFLEHGKTSTYHLRRNHRLWQYCRFYPHLCWNSQFMSDFCKLFPLQSMKICHLRLSLTEILLSDPELDKLHIVLLVRDPRGTLQSRKPLDWCKGQANCDNPAVLCGDLEADYWTAQRLLKKFPNRLKVVRYEDLSLEPYTTTQSILNFYGLPFDMAVKKYLDSHTRVNSGNSYSTFRESHRTPFHWINELSFDEIDRIQANCVRAMELWGYRPAERTTFLRRTFNPLRNYTMNLS